jgi:hypothetical protein
MENLEFKDLEYIDIIVDDLNIFHIDRINIVDFSVITKNITLEEPEELMDCKYKAIEEGLIVIDKLENIKNESINRKFSENDKLIQLRIKYKEKELEIYYITYQENNSQLIALNEKGNLFITIQEQREMN